MSEAMAKSKLVVLAIAAHPDDIEFFMAGTMLRLQAKGAELHMWNLCNGSCGTEEFDRDTIVAMRAAEAQAAADCVGATLHPAIVDDLELMYDVPTLRRVAAGIRQIKPDIVLTHSPVDYMEDHQNACRLAVTASFSRGMPNFRTDPPATCWSGQTVLYHALPHGLCNWVRQPVMAELYVDVGAQLDAKKQMLSQHVSQKEWLDVSQCMNAYLDTLEALAGQVGSQTPAFRFAEGWRRHAHWGFGPAEADPLCDLLGDAIWLNPDYQTVASL